MKDKDSDILFLVFFAFLILNGGSLIYHAFQPEKLLCEITDISIIKNFYFQTPGLQVFHHHIAVYTVPLTTQYTKRTKCQPLMEMNSPPFAGVQHSTIRPYLI